MQHQLATGINSQIQMSRMQSKLNRPPLSREEFECLKSLYEQGVPAPYVDFSIQHRPMYKLINKKLIFRSMTYPTMKYMYTLTNLGKKITELLKEMELYERE